MQYLSFPERDGLGHGMRDAYYQGAVICRRAHVITRFVDPGEAVDADQKCSTCGASVLIGCTNCGIRIRGGHFVTGVVAISKYTPPPFCDACGAAHPWATREQRIYELENMLDEQNIDEADRVFLHDRLRELRELGGTDSKAEERVWKAIGQRGSAFLHYPPAQKIVETLATQAIKLYLFKDSS